jgi:hypothetical protein
MNCVSFEWNVYVWCVGVYWECVLMVLGFYGVWLGLVLIGVMCA